MSSLYVFIDESGTFDFSNNPGATEWLVLTSALLLGLLSVLGILISDLLLVVVDPRIRLYK